MAFVQVVHGGEDFRLVHGVHLDALSDTLDEGDGELAAEMFAELFKTFQYDPFVLVVVGQKQFVEEFEP